MSIYNIFANKIYEIISVDCQVYFTFFKLLKNIKILYYLLYRHFSYYFIISFISYILLSFLYMFHLNKVIKRRVVKFRSI